MISLIRDLKTQGHEEKIVHFAAVILTTLALVFMLSMAMYYWSAEDSTAAANKIFESCLQVLPPIATLVIGYFFGRREASARSEKGLDDDRKHPPAGSK